MYVPAAFAVDDQPTLFDFAERHSFATLISQHDGVPLASHLPLLVDRAHGERGLIVGHMARANPQWTDAAGQNVLVVFAGPHAYVSPTWYAEPNTVPTWNYTAVHAYGRLELLDDADELLALLARTVDVYERSMLQPWRFARTTTLAAALVKQIVGFRIAVDRWEGKWKLNQNHSAERRKRVIAALSTQSSDDSRAVAELMRANL